MKTNYIIKNFRAFDKNGARVEFAPLTFLVGCNSSGKSSIVKSLFLLKSFFMNDFDKKHPVIGSTIDFTLEPLNTLGSFNNVVRTSSRDKIVSLSYDVHSSYINDDVVVTLSMSNGDLGNAIISGVDIAKKDGTTLVSASSENHYLTGSLIPIKEAFAYYLIATRFRAKVFSLLPRDPDSSLSSTSKGKIKQLWEEAQCHCSADYLVKKG